MARTKQIAWKNRNAKTLRARPSVQKGDADVKPNLKQESDLLAASGSSEKRELDSSPANSSDVFVEDFELETKAEIKSPKSPRKDYGRAPPVSWTKEETKALLDVQYEVAKENMSRFLEKTELAGRNTAKIHGKLKGMHAAAIKALESGPSDVRPKSERVGGLLS
ncbi:hypothetical protein NDA11_003101 [Ustilago hordei]|uniref:Uncharacterized protein n=1 Tax=Ustilago hordei TaxID=120017 RepID=I2G021_USTHO|nr:uncharacterized protein UHO2_03694 [Ustilago hordei]KAJ1044069.1 hypothetical protein NDA10_006421 [Ustilago hordei]KAJ1579102.1 hypothetical protein NDA15_005871 [Ustilago hordei]KAJ1580756.1 hypothetical protein NDA12_005843 [Ustilago hordei]KAJ1581425.1 hypothetical protein NDA11_003101 [Ustilago hordei]KAJ1597306.1 hypothetical protein NDA14_003581 [Ustilago hordei]